MIKKRIVESVAKTSRLVIAQEGPRVGGWAAEISAMINEDVFEYLSAPIKRITSIDAPVAYAPVLEDFVLPKLENLIKACREVMQY